VFDERFPNTVLYVEDVSATAAHWRGVFLAETGSATGMRITLAEDAIVVNDPANNQFELHLRGGSTHEFDPHDPLRYNVSTFGSSDLPIAISSSERATPSLSDAELPVAALLKIHGPGWRDSRIEFYRRLAFPAACLVFAMLGVSAGIRPRRGGRASGLVLTLLLIAGYYMLLLVGIRLAQQGLLHPAVGCGPQILSPPSLRSHCFAGWSTEASRATCPACGTNWSPSGAPPSLAPRRPPRTAAQAG